MGHDKRFANFQPRTTEIYGNYLVLDDVGDEMFRCIKKKANWYLKRDLAKVITENPPVIQLTFKPKGKGWSGDPYYLSQKLNVCAQCGESNIELLSKHHIVPYAYRKFMPVEVKQANSFDVTPMCLEHHFSYEQKADLLKYELAAKYDAPIHNKMSPKQKFIKNVTRSSYLLLNRPHVIPDDKKEMMKKTLLEYFGHENYSNEDLDKASKLNYKRDINPEYEHAQIVMSKVENLQEFVEMWRIHFLENVKPEFLPEGWDPKRPIYRMVKNKT